MTEKQWTMISAVIKGINRARDDLSRDRRGTMARTFRAIHSGRYRGIGIANAAYIACVVIAWGEDKRPDDVLP